MNLRNAFIACEIWKILLQSKNIPNSNSLKVLKATPKIEYAPMNECGGGCFNIVRTVDSFAR